MLLLPPSSCRSERTPCSKDDTTNGGNFVNTEKDELKMNLACVVDDGLARE